MRRKFLLATLTTIVLGATAMPAAAMPAAALDVTSSSSTGSDTGIVHVEPAQEELGAAVVDADVDAEEGSGSLTAGGYLAPADEGGAVTVSGSSDGPAVEQDEYTGPTADQDPIVIGQEGVGEVSVDPETLTVGVVVEPLGVDESVSLTGGEEEAPAEEPAPTAPVAAQPSAPAPSQPQATTQPSTPAPAPVSSGPREVFSPGPREVFAKAESSQAFEFSTPEADEPVVADGVQAAGPLGTDGQGANDALLKLFALLMFGTTGYAWWFAKENGLA